MPIQTPCESCNAVLRLADKLAGKVVACPKCEMRLVVPTADEAAAELLLGHKPTKLVQKSEPEANETPQTEVAVTLPVKPLEADALVNATSVAPASQVGLPKPNIRPCLDCGGVVSKRAATCPHCGCPVTEANAATNSSPVNEVSQPASSVQATPAGAAILLFIGVGFLVAAFITNQTLKDEDRRQGRIDDALWSVNAAVGKYDTQYNKPADRTVVYILACLGAGFIGLGIVTWAVATKQKPVGEGVVPALVVAALTEHEPSPYSPDNAISEGKVMVFMGVFILVIVGLLMLCLFVFR